MFPRAPNLFHVLPSRMVGWNDLCTPDCDLYCNFHFFQKLTNVLQIIIASSKKKPESTLSMFTIMGELDNFEIKHGIEKYKDEENKAHQCATRYLD